MAGELAQGDDFEIAGAEIVGVEFQCAGEMIEGLGEIFPPAVDLRQRMIRRPLPRRVPGGFIKRVVGIIVAAQETQRQAQVVMRLTIIRIGIARGQARDGRAKMFLRQVEFAPPQMVKAQRIVAAAIQRIAAERFAPVHHRIARGVAVLLQMQAGDVEFVGAGDVPWKRRLGGGRGNGGLRPIARLIRDDRRVGRIGHHHAQDVVARQPRQ